MSSAAAEGKSEGGLGAGAAGGGGGKLLLIFSGVNLVVTLGIIALLLITFRRETIQPRAGDIVASQKKADAKGEDGKKGEAAAKSEDGATAQGGDGKGAAAVEEFGKMVTLDQFTVNLLTPGTSSPKYVRVNVSLEVPNEDTETEVNAKIPQVRNIIIDLFNSKRAADLSTADGRQYLKEEIRNALNGILAHGKIRGVYFTNFALAG